MTGSDSLRRQVSNPRGVAQAIGMNTAPKLATYEDVLNAPEHVVAELVHGVLHTMPRPAPRHAHAIISLGGNLQLPFGRGRGGPGGWVVLIEPELHLGQDVLVADLWKHRHSTRCRWY